MQWESAPLDVGHLEEREAEVSDRQDSGTLRSASNASSCTVHAVDQNAPFVYDPSASASLFFGVAAPLENVLLALGI